MATPLSEVHVLAVDPAAGRARWRATAEPFHRELPDDASFFLRALLESARGRGGRCGPLADVDVAAGAVVGRLSCASDFWLSVASCPRGDLLAFVEWDEANGANGLGVARAGGPVIARRRFRGGDPCRGDWSPQGRWLAAAFRCPAPRAGEVRAFAVGRPAEGAGGRAGASG